MNISIRDVIKWVVRWSIIPIILVSQFLYFVAWVTIADDCTGTGRATYFYQGRFVCAEDDLTWVIMVCDGTVINIFILLIWLFAHHFKHTRLIRILLLLYLFVFRLLLIDWMDKTYVIPPPPQ